MNWFRAFAAVCVCVCVCVCKLRSSLARIVALCVVATASRIFWRCAGSGTSLTSAQPTVRTLSPSEVGGM